MTTTHKFPLQSKPIRLGGGGSGSEDGEMEEGEVLRHDDRSYNADAEEAPLNLSGSSKAAAEEERSGSLRVLGRELLQGWKLLCCSHCQ